MSSCGVFEVDLWIKGKKFTHPVNVIQELKENIIVIEFIHSQRLTYDIIASKVKFANTGTNSVNVDENNICSIVLENCAPYDVTLE